ncbi:hypothetical protein VTL71DRAFT_496 [Oculimacula yallundae]|uniref:GH16 domain-containing protein n=1 Tax=Oculimacula yallundae TaxID=86028 RepID=A0ABR4D079_9HELO
MSSFTSNMSSFKVLAALLALAPGISAALPPAPAGYKLTWGDDFSGNGLPDPKNWIITTGTQYPGGAPNFGTGEVQTYTNSPKNLNIADGILSITPLRENNKWTSARIETKRIDFVAAKGKKMRIEGSLAMPDIKGVPATGYWPAFWTLGGAFRGVYTNWPIVGEFDLMENVNGLDKTWSTLHCDINPGGKCDETNGISGNSPCGNGKPCQGNFHTYAVVVDRSVTPEKMTFEVDGKVFNTITETQLGAQIWANTVHGGCFILLNLAMGGSFPNKVAGSPTPIEATKPGVPFRIQHVAVFNSV